MIQNDLEVVHLSRARQQLTVYPGSIGSIEAPKFIRSMRRLGATVTPYMTEGARNFLTPLSLSWAAANECVVSFSGSSTHLAMGDACVVAPASANFIGKIARGELSCHSSALVASSRSRQACPFTTKYAR